MQISSAAATTALLAALALPAGAATSFDFFWTGDPIANPEIARSDTANAWASGVFVIDSTPNATIGPADVVSFSLVFGTRDAGLFEMTPTNADSFFFAGTVSEDGRSIVMRDLYVATTGNVQRFGCDSIFGTCERAGDRHIVLTRDADTFGFLYSSEVTARAALRFSAQQVSVIPLPATLPLLVGALGLLGLARRRAK